MKWSFNNKLKNKLGNFCNSKLVCIDSSRRYFTRHGLHMNGLGKEVLALKITEEVKRFTHSKEKPIPLMWMEDTAGVNGLPNESQGKIRRSERTRKPPQKINNHFL